MPRGGSPIGSVGFPRPLGGRAGPVGGDGGGGFAGGGAAAARRAASSRALANSLAARLLKGEYCSNLSSISNPLGSIKVVEPFPTYQYRFVSPAPKPPWFRLGRPPV